MLLWKHSKTLCKLSAFYFFKANNMKQTIFEGIKFKLNLFFLPTDVYVTNCYFCIFFCHFTLKCTFFQPVGFIALWKSYQKISQGNPQGYLQFISIYLTKYFCFPNCQHYVQIFLTVFIYNTLYIYINVNLCMYLNI